MLIGKKYNILIFEKDNSNKWFFKSKLIILNQIDKSIGIAYNDHIINITKVSSENDSNVFNEIDYFTLDRKDYTACHTSTFSFPIASSL